MLVVIIQLITISLIVINYFIKKKKSRESIMHLNINAIKERFNIKFVLIFIGFSISLLLLCISTLLNQISNNEYSIVRRDYKENFTFFYRVPIYFYFFLGASIFFLAYIIFYFNNKGIMLISISIFIYCLWILPYLQIGNYFGNDSRELELIYINYINRGIVVQSSYNFVIPNYSSLRYSTSLFTSILLINGTGTDIKFSLMFLYPIIFILMPFFFYSVFQKFSEKSDKNKLNLSLLTVLAIISPLIIKYAHSATTVVMGLYIFFILVIEFHYWIHQYEFQLKHLIFIIILYLFLSLTHFEESIYFILVVALYGVYYLFSRIKYTNKYKKIGKFHERFLDRITLLLFLLLAIFFLTQEFFGYIAYYMGLFENIPFLDTISILYNYFKFTIPIILNGNYRISLFFGGLIIIVALLYFLIVSFSFFNFFHILNKIYEKLVGVLVKIHNFLKKIISTKIFQIILPIIIIGIIIAFDILYFPFLKEEGLLILIEILLNYSFVIFNIFLFIKGVIYYKIRNEKENYFLLSIIACTSLMIIFSLVGNFYFAFGILNVKFISYFIFFNLLIIQNNYFKDFINKKKTLFFIILIALLLLFGTIYSLKELRYG